MKNLELKSKCTDIKAAIKIAGQIGAIFSGVLMQKDVFYSVPNGRLKLRTINNSKSELIYYFRENSSKARESEYEIVHVPDGKQIDKILRKNLGVRGTVIKKRILYLYQNVRIHFDRVNGLGDYMEFEIVCKSKKDFTEAPKKMKYLRAAFNVKEKHLLSKSYIDYLNAKNGS